MNISINPASEALTKAAAKKREKEKEHLRRVFHNPFETVQINPNPFRKDVNISKERRDATAMGDNF